MDYDKSKEVGDIIEVEILKILQKKDCDAFIDNTGKVNSDWDIYLPNLKYGVEVKGDYKSKETRNLVVEVKFDDKPSALSLTKAKWWVFVEGYRFIWIKPINIYRFIDHNRIEYHKPVHFKGSGDTKHKDAYLIRHEPFVSYVYTLDNDEGFIKMIPDSHILYFDNYMEQYEKIENK